MSLPEPSLLLLPRWQVYESDDDEDEEEEGSTGDEGSLREGSLSPAEEAWVPPRARAPLPPPPTPQPLLKPWEEIGAGNYKPVNVRHV